MCVGRSAHVSLNIRGTLVIPSIEGGSMSVHDSENDFEWFVGILPVMV
jgi:hypothetical protein